jgi:hypothetical protein
MWTALSLQNYFDWINVIEYRRGKQNQRNGQQDEEKQNKNTTEYVLNTTMRKQIQIT